MATKKPQKKKKTPKRFTGFYPPNAKLTTQDGLYREQLIGTNPVGRTLNYGW